MRGGRVPRIGQLLPKGGNNRVVSAAGGGTLCQTQCDMGIIVICVGGMNASRGNIQCQKLTTLMK